MGRPFGVLGALAGRTNVFSRHARLRILFWLAASSRASAVHGYGPPRTHRSNTLVLPARHAVPCILSALASLDLLFAACAPAGPPPIRPGTLCATCGMAIEDLRYACVRRAGKAWKQYDSIECLLRDPAAGAPGGASYLADYDTRTLAPAQSLWVVKGEFPSPMAGGLAAFRDRGAAGEIAARTHGRVGRLGDFAGAAP